MTDLVDVAAEWAESLELCKIYYGLGGADPLPNDAPAVDRSQISGELILHAMVNAVFALATRRPISAEDIDAWRLGAARAGVETLAAVRNSAVGSHSLPTVILRAAPFATWSRRRLSTCRCSC